MRSVLRFASIILMASACALPQGADLEAAREKPDQRTRVQRDVFSSQPAESDRETPPAPPSEPPPTDNPPAPTMNTQPAPMAGRLAPPAPSDCARHDEAPISTEEEARAAGNVGLTSKVEKLGEVKGGLAKTYLLDPHDAVSLGRTLDPIRTFTGGGDGISPLAAAPDADADCLPDTEETRLGTDPSKPDSDGDGWFDGACNERRVLFLESVRVRETQDWWITGGDDFYLIADDVRYPNSNLDDWVTFGSGDFKTLDRAIASRTRGTAKVALAKVSIEGWEDDFEIFNTWGADDLLFSSAIDLGAYPHGSKITKRHQTGDYDYEVVYRVEIERFADPNPLSDGDSDKDGIKESAEAKVAADFGGVTDPTRADVLVEVDWMRGHRFRTESKRQVVTRLYQHKIQLFVWRDEEVPLDGCLAVPEAKSYYNKYFTNRDYDAFRYAIVGEQIWNDASGVAWGDIFLMDDSTWWISDMVLPQAGTFIHELGHTMGLTKEVFDKIDSIAWLSYESAMNYTFQALMVDYEGDGSPFHDWNAVKPASAMRWSFGLVSSTEKGICK